MLRVRGYMAHNTDTSPSPHHHQICSGDCEKTRTLSKGTSLESKETNKGTRKDAAQSGLWKLRIQAFRAESFTKIWKYVKIKQQGEHPSALFLLVNGQPQKATKCDANHVYIVISSSLSGACLCPLSKTNAVGTNNKICEKSATANKTSTCENTAVLLECISLVLENGYLTWIWHCSCTKN